MNEIPIIAKPRRPGRYLNTLWINDDALNEKLGEVTPFAEIYVLRHSVGSIVVCSVFQALDQLVERLQSQGCLGGDLVEIFAVGEQQLELRAKVPDLEGLAPIDFAGDDNG